MGQQQFNFSPIRGDEAGSVTALLSQTNKQFIRLNSVLKGPETFAVVSVARAINPGLVDLTTVLLASDAMLTLEMVKTRPGSEGKIELTQDGTGGWVPSWTNALTSPSIDATPNARTLLLAVRVSDGWVLTLLAAGY